MNPDSKTVFKAEVSIDKKQQDLGSDLVKELVKEFNQKSRLDKEHFQSDLGVHGVSFDQAENFST